MSVLIKFKLFLVSIFYENKFTIKIFENTVLRIPSSVQLIENCAIDNKISNSIIELDEMGTCIMKSIMKYGELKFFTLIEEYQQMFPKIERKKMIIDIQTFLLALNQAGLLQIKPIRSTFSLGFYWNLWRYKVGYRNRYDIEKKGLVLFVQTCLALMDTYLWLLMLIIISCVLFVTISLMFSINFIFLWLYITLVISLVFSLSFHEVMHITVFRYLTQSKDGYLYSKRLSVGFFRKVLPLKQTILVRISGPVLTCILGILLFFVSFNIYLKLMGLIFILHIINLLPIFGDGYELVSDILNRSN